MISISFMTSIVLNTTSPPPPSHRPQESPIGSGKPHLHGHNGHDGRDGHDGHDGHDGQIPPLCRFLSEPPLLAVLALCQQPEIGNVLNFTFIQPAREAHGPKGPAR